MHIGEDRQMKLVTCLAQLGGLLEVALEVLETGLVVDEKDAVLGATATLWNADVTTAAMVVRVVHGSYRNQRGRQDLSCGAGAGTDARNWSLNCGEKASARIAKRPES